jgi:Transposase DDE domain
MIPQSSGCGRRLYKIVQPILEEATVDGEADRYRKHFKAQSHAWILILHMMRGANSLRQSHAQFGADPKVRSKLHITQWISLSQLARSSTSRPPGCFEQLLMRVLTVARSQAKGIDDAHWRFLDNTKALDSTFLGLSAKLSPWSVCGGHAAGVRVHFGYELASHIPDMLCLTQTDVNDNMALGQLCEKDPTPFAGWTLVMDLGYYGHKQFERLRQWDIHFLSKLHPQALYEVTERLQVTQKRGWTPQDDEVVADEIITLGSPNNRRGAVLEQIRLVTSRTPDGRICRLITDRHDLAAWEVAALYRRRWQIELFFRWLKRQLGAVRPLGYSKEAIWLTVLIASLVALLCSLVEGWGQRPGAMTRICWLHAVGVALQLRINLSG